MSSPAPTGTVAPATGATGAVPVARRGNRSAEVDALGGQRSTGRAAAEQQHQTRGDGDQRPAATGGRTARAGLRCDGSGRAVAGSGAVLAVGTTHSG